MQRSIASRIPVEPIMSEPTERSLEGTVLVGRDLEPRAGRVVIENGAITAVEEIHDEGGRIILPAPVNAHTHIGDSVAKDAGAGLDLDALVAPPDGLKHRRLEAADRSGMIRAMRRTVRFMHRTGTGGFMDFRENGVPGVRALRQALSDANSEIECRIFGRGPASVLEEADGYGASGAADADFTEARAAANAREKPFGIHAGEVSAADIDPALDLDPDFLVHMIHASPAHLRSVGDREISVVVCPRTNLATGVGRPPIRELLDRTNVALGTDNVMLTAPNLLREMDVTARLFDVSDVEVLRMATIAGSDLLGVDWGAIQAGTPARLLVLDATTDNLAGTEDPIRAVVRRAEPSDIEAMILS